MTAIEQDSSWRADSFSLWWKVKLLHLIICTSFSGAVVCISQDLLLAGEILFCPLPWLHKQWHVFSALPYWAWIQNWLQFRSSCSSGTAGSASTRTLYSSPSRIPFPGWGARGSSRPDTAATLPVCTAAHGGNPHRSESIRALAAALWSLKIMS